MKRILALLLSAILMLGIAVPAYAVGDENIDGGGGDLGNGTSTSYWNPGMDGVRVSVIDADSHAVVGNVIDLTNKTPASGIIHFGKVSKLSYNAGRSISPVVGNYSYINPSQSLPRIISSGSYPASIDAIRSYFTDEQVIRAIAGYVGMDFDTLICGDYKLVIEPIAYLVYSGANYAMTATEAALYDQTVSGNLRYWMGSLTHKNLPLAIFLEEADLGYPAWGGSTTSKVSNDQIISSLGIGIVRFNDELEPPEIDEFDYEYRVDTDVITSVEVSGGQSDPDNPVTVQFIIEGNTYTVSNVYYPEGDSQLVWVKWHTWLQVVKNFSRYDTSRDFEPWITKICVNLYRNALRRLSKSPILHFRNNEEKEFLLCSIPAPEKVDYRPLYEAIDHLPEKYRLVVILYYFDDRDIAATAQILGIPKGTVKSRLDKARKLLKEAIGNETDL